MTATFLFILLSLSVTPIHCGLVLSSSYSNKVQCYTLKFGNSINLEVWESFNAEQPLAPSDFTIRKVTCGKVFFDTYEAWLFKHEVRFAALKLNVKKISDFNQITEGELKANVAVVMTNPKNKDFELLYSMHDPRGCEVSFCSQQSFLILDNNNFRPGVLFPGTGAMCAKFFPVKDDPTRKKLRFFTRIRCILTVINKAVARKYYVLAKMLRFKF